MGILLAQGKQQYFDSNGDPLVGGKLYSMQPGAGITTPKATWTDAGETALNTNPIILNARGEAQVFWSGAYNVRLETAAGGLIWTVESIGVSVPAAPVTLADLASTTDVAKGDALVGFKRMFTSAAASTLHAWHEAQVIDAVAECGMSTAGSAAANTLALQVAISAAVVLGGGQVEVQAGNYALTAGTNFAAQNVSIIGRGKPTFDFSAGAGIGFKLDAGGVGAHLSRMRIENIDFKGGVGITDIFYSRGIVSSIYRNLNAREGTNAGFKILFGVSLELDKLICSIDVQTMANYPTYAHYFGDDGTGGNDCSNVTSIGCEGKVPGKTGLALANGTARCHWIGGAYESCATGISILSDLCWSNVFVSPDLESNTTSDIVVKGKSNVFVGVFSNSPGAGNTIDVTTATGTVFEGGGYCRQIVLGAGSSNTHFSGISTDETIGFSGTGSFTRSGCKKADNSAVAVGVWPDVLGPTATSVAYVCTQGVTPGVTLTDAEAIISGQFVNLQARFSFTGAGTAASPILVSFPAAYTARTAALGKPVGGFTYTKAGTYTSGVAILQATTQLSFIVNQGTNLFGTNPATTIANTDVLSIGVCIPVA